MVCVYSCISWGAEISCPAQFLSSAQPVPKITRTRPYLVWGHNPTSGRGNFSRDGARAGLTSPSFLPLTLAGAGVAEQATQWLYCHSHLSSTQPPSSVAFFLSFVIWIFVWLFFSNHHVQQSVIEKPFQTGGVGTKSFRVTLKAKSSRLPRHLREHVPMSCLLFIL